MSARLTESQSRAVHTVGVPLVVTASAGSGKTTVLVSRFLELLKRGAPARSILTVTFTTEAAEQLKRRLVKQIDGDDAGEPSEVAKAVEASPFIGTLHGFCYWILNQFGSVAGLRPVESIVSPFEFAVAFDDAYRRWTESLPPTTLRRLIKRYKPPELRSLLRELYQRRHRFAEGMARVSGDAEDAQLLRLVDETTRDFRAALQSHFFARGQYQFDDLEHLAQEILDKSPDTVLRLRKQFRYALVDEFQDTSLSQWKLLETLFGTDLDKIFIVGDPKQSIYGFRDAEVKLFFQVTKMATERGGEQVYLAQNFRSTAHLIEKINRISERLFDNAEVPFYPMEAGNESDAADTSCETVNYGSGNGTRPDASRLEIAAVVERVKQRVSEGASPDSITVLFRVSDRIPNFAQALRLAGFPVRTHRTKSLLGTYDSLDVLSYLRAVNNPLDNLALGAFLASPYVGLSPIQLFELGERQKERNQKNLFEALALDCPPALAWLVTLIESGELSVMNALRTLVQNSAHFPAGSPALYGLMEPLSEPGLTLPEAIRKLESWEDEMLMLPEESAPSEKGVQLMTVHNAKGLEFPHVFLVDLLRQKPRRDKLLLMKEGRPPGIRYRNQAEWETSGHFSMIAQEMDYREREESRRVLYVALTRAIQSITIFLPEEKKLVPKDSWAELLA